MKKITTLGLLLSMMMACICFSACSDDVGSEENTDFICGTWYGVRSYYNPVSGTKFQYLTITFNSDKIGEMDYETPSGYTAYYFAYSISDNIITCEGAKADTDGDVDDNFVLKLKIEGDRLIPINRYTAFILTRDGSVETDGDGNEIIDQSDLLIRDWIRADGLSILSMNNSTNFTEYLLSAPNSNKYYYYENMNYSYDKRYKKIIFGNTTYEILQLDSDKLCIKNSAQSVVIEFRSATKNDIPTIHDVNTLLYQSFYWNNNETRDHFTFKEDGTVVYMKNSNVNIGSWGPATLVADGTYIVNGNNILCNFKTVDWEGGYLDEYKNIFFGWTYNESCTKTYYIEYNGGNEIIITDSNNRRTKYTGVL